MVRRISLLMLLALVGLLVAPSAAAGGGCHQGYGTEMTSERATLVPIGKCAFRPTVTYIEPGQEVTWVNKDPVPHTVSGANYSWGTERLLDHSDRVSYTFKKEGVYPYYCLLHPGMVGAVVVGDATKAAAITNGMADVESGDLAAASSGEDVAVEPSSLSMPATIGLGLAVLIAIALGAFAWRTLALRRRAGVATSAP